MTDYAIRADQRALDDLRQAMAEADLDPRLWQTEGRAVPGQLGEPLTVAILLAIGAAIGVDVAKDHSKKALQTLRKVIKEWHEKHSAARFYRDPEGCNDEINWPQMEADLNEAERAASDRI